MKLGEAIKTQRKTIGASASWLTKELGVSRNTILNWERGKTEPTSSYLYRLSNVLGCTLDDLLNSEELSEPIRIPLRFCPGA